MKLMSFAAPRTREAARWGRVPSTFVTGYKYAGLGYTTAFDAAVRAAGGAARPSRAGRHAVPRQGVVRAGGQQPLRHAMHRARRSRAAQDVPRVAARRREAYAAKLVNPGGVEVWKHSPASARPWARRRRAGFQRHRRGESCARSSPAANELALPHPAHIHCNQLGMPGNWRTTLETMRAVEGRRGALHAHPVSQLRRRRRAKS